MANGDHLPTHRNLVPADRLSPTKVFRGRDFSTAVRFSDAALALALKALSSVRGAPFGRDDDGGNGRRRRSLPPSSIDLIVQIDENQSVPSNESTNMLELDQWDARHGLPRRHRAHINARDITSFGLLRARNETDSNIRSWGSCETRLPNNKGVPSARSPA
jgi:hypothetical protein